MNKGGEDIVLVKMDIHGSIIWKKSFGGSDHDCGRAIDWSPVLGIVVAGSIRSNDRDFRLALRGKWDDAFLSRHNQRGELLWKRVLGGAENDIASSVAIAGDSAIVVVGSTSSRDGDFKSRTDTNVSCSFMAKYNANGTELWRANLYGIGVGGNGLKIDSLGNIFIVGSVFVDYGSPIANDDYSSDILISKYNPDGKQLWSNVIGGRGNEQAAAICFSNDGGIVIAGQTASDKGDQFNDGIFSGLGKGVPNDPLKNGDDIFIIKLDENGKLINSD
jgi:hypothetical protein